MKTLTIISLVLCWTYIQGICTSDKCPKGCKCSQDNSRIFCIQQNMTNIPELPEQAKYVTFHRTNISRIKHTDFQNCTNLQYLNISHSQLNKIDNNSFPSLHNLSLLDLSYNANLLHFLNSNSYILKELKVKTLVLRQINQCPFTAFDVSMVPASVEYLDIGMNNIYRIDGIMHIHAPNLTEMNLDYNRFAITDPQLNQFDKLQHLTKIILDQQFKFPSSFVPGNCSTEGARPSIVGEERARQDFSFVHHHNVNLTIAPNMRYLSCLDAFAGMFSEAIGKVRFYGGPTTIDVLDFSQNFIRNFSGSVWFENVTHIDVMNLSFCNSHNMNNNFFENNTTLTIRSLDLTFNGIGDALKKDNSSSFFVNYRDMKIEVLNLSNCQIKFLYPGVFYNLTSLIYLNVKNNAIHTWEPSLHFQKGLQVLDLSNNALPLLDDKFLKYIDKVIKIKTSQNKSFQINLAENPLELQCIGQETLKYLLRWNLTRNLADSHNYIFFYGDQKRGFNRTVYNAISSECSSRMLMIYATVVLCLTIFLIVVSIIVYRHRWDIRFFCLRLFRPRVDYVPLSDDPDYDYDASVACHPDDYPWVRHHLLINLENAPRPFRLCLPERDFPLGVSKFDAISQSINNSRNTIVVVSSRSRNDPWYDFTTQLAWLRSYDIGREVSVVVALDDIDLQDLPGSLVSLRLRLEQREWLRWPDDDRERQIFWRLLSMALSTPRERPNIWRSGRTMSDSSYRSVSVDSVN